MRQKHYIQQLNQKDEQFCYVLKNCQHLSKAQAQSIISQNRINSYIKEQVIRRVHYIENGKQHLAYELTHKGRDFIKYNYPQYGNNFYLSSTAVKHNIALANQVIEHSQNNNRTWLNERDLREQLLDRIEQASPEERFHILGQLERGELSFPDGGYINESGELECIEITTDTYGQVEIELKESTAAVFNASITFISR